ncbi:hypothetical protein [Reichenbachiella versicolor]|uniref:hypothetical protein n=1 Tax=Reichenbachiella versicolor TaxID=1821036 RepID=UPI000D6E08AE|nr:hypothetical protein [Reichenbachiella versicolor]
MKYFFLIGFLFITHIGLGQGIMKRDGLMKMDQGADAMADGKYVIADELFREAMGLLEKLPSDLAYYFGRNSFHLGKYKQSINWLTKYVELKGTPGKFFDEASRYLELSTIAFQKQKDDILNETVKKLTEEEYYDCPAPIVMCPVCQGTGVLITPGKFGAIYQTCPVSGLSGRMTCDEYNEYLKGELYTPFE